MNEQQQQFERWLAEQIAACKQRGKLLAENERMDEATFEKIRANVYEIFKTILSVAERVCGNDDRARRDFFNQKAGRSRQAGRPLMRRPNRMGMRRKCTSNASSLIRSGKSGRCVCRSGGKVHD